MNNVIPAANKRVYVPTVRRKKEDARAVIPAHLARVPAGAAMRGVNWTGAETPPFVAPPPAAPVHPTMSVRAVFAETPWSGERTAEPTSDQGAKTVKSILDQFRWE